ncbi:uncharacterized protein N7479_002407 [Penicillium vulpinum]|uniref:Uncharacterized protein n=1 Tax=Penicillium vulpinum TaxID=29845 RepID=A0A1V6S6R4_9EURO|nr:uncharacterized protein N7479_002407 [Penicillium vulpinum]KAJ5972489.1 hypothetical protein N7479_002407 [Penicillium vulpinum]OQE09745.1 hypothetical protein PENVUL_c005G08745 [Penicillium vulpinum]
MLEVQDSPDKTRPPRVDDSGTTQESPSKTSQSPPRNALGPVLVFMARATQAKDKDYPSNIVTNTRMHIYLRAMLAKTIVEHRKRFGILGFRPHRIQTTLQAAQTRTSSVSRSGKFLIMALEEARTSKTECIFVMLGWDGWTTDKITIAELCNQFWDVPFTFHVYANRGDPCEFFVVNAHKVNAYFRKMILANDPAIVGDGATALYIRIVETLPTLHFSKYHAVMSVQEKQTLAKYDKRYAGVYKVEEIDVPELATEQPDAPNPDV